VGERGARPSRYGFWLLALTAFRIARAIFSARPIGDVVGFVVLEIETEQASLVRLCRLQLGDVRPGCIQFADEIVIGLFKLGVGRRLALGVGGRRRVEHRAAPDDGVRRNPLDAPLFGQRGTPRYDVFRFLIRIRAI
jgi:hypothetical protein